MNDQTSNPLDAIEHADIEHADIDTPAPATESNPNSRAARRRQAREASRENRTYSDHVVAAQSKSGRELQMMSREQRRAVGVRVPFEALT